MNSIPLPAKERFDSVLEASTVPMGQRRDFRKWYAYYWDFCHKYQWNIHSEASLHAFLLKLQEKGQTQERLEQARQAICLTMNQNGKPALPEKISPIKPSPLPKKPSQTSKKAEPEGNLWQGLYDDLARVIQTRHYSPKTLKSYKAWVRQFQTFVQSKDPKQISNKDVKDFLSWLAVTQHVAAASQNQAFNALLFLFKHVLKRPMGQLKNTERAKRKPYIPVVLSRPEIDRILLELNAPYDLIVKLLYGCGLRLKECISLRVQNFNLDLGVLTVHDGKGKKDRTLPLPQVLIPELEQQMARVARLHQADLAVGSAGTFLFHKLDKKYKNASKELVWQCLSRR